MLRVDVGLAFAEAGGSLSESMACATTSTTHSSVEEVVDSITQHSVILSVIALSANFHFQVLQMTVFLSLLAVNAKIVT